MQQLINFIKSKISIDENDLQIILSKFTIQSVKKGSFVLRKGQTPNQYFYTQSGGLRFSYGDYNTFNTTWIVLENQFFTEMSRPNRLMPTSINIEAIEDTELLCITYADMEWLYANIPSWNEFARKTWEGLMVQMIEQIINFQTLSAEERYLEFMKSPEVLQKVPVKNVASLLGITPNALSRIRKNIKIVN